MPVTRITPQVIWDEWNKQDADNPAPVKTIAAQLGISTGEVARVVYPEPDFGTWQDNHEPDLPPGEPDTGYVAKFLFELEPRLNRSFTVIYRQLDDIEDELEVISAHAAAQSDRLGKVEATLAGLLTALRDYHRDVMDRD
jgi:hypothetical protein